MAGMSKADRAKFYLDKLRNSTDPVAEAERILKEIDTLVDSLTKQPISDNGKRLIIEEMENQLRQLKEGNLNLEDFHKSTAASDNSNILDLISSMKKRVKK